MHAIKVLVLVASALMVLPAAAQEAYPAKTITMVVGNLPGASLEVYARLFARKLSENMKHSVLVDFKPGAGTTIASSFIAKAAPDGYVIGLISPSFTTAPLQYKTLPFDPIESFAPISLTSSDAYVLMVNPSFAVKSVQEYIAYARANPGKINVGTTGAGAFNHLASAWLHLLTKTKATFIHYKGGSQVIADVLGGQIQGSLNSIQLAKPLGAAGKVRIIGITSAKRSAAMPDLPSFAEQGVTGYDALNWIGFIAPAKTPPAIVNRLNREFNAALRSDEIMSTLTKTGGEPMGTTPEDFKRFLVDELARWKNLVREGNIDLESGS